MKKLFGIMALVAIAATASWNFCQNQDKVELSDLSLVNVEALAQSELLPDACHYTIVVRPGTDLKPTRDCIDGGSSFCF